MDGSAGILIFGHDKTLLQTRRLILERDGFEIRTATAAAEAVQALILYPFDLFVLCQTLSSVECESALTAAHTLRPNMNNLVLGVDCYGTATDARDTFLTRFLDPGSLVTIVRRTINIETVPAFIN